jgi:hypothetical protein
MAKKPKMDKAKGPLTSLRTGPGGMTMRELHERVKQSHQRDQAAGKPQNKLSQPQNRWQRAIRYVWDKNRGRG